MARGCSVSGCGRPHKGKGYCNTHYARMLRGIVVDGPVRTRGGGLQFIETEAVPHDGRVCLIWPFSRTTKGYARQVIDGRESNASRIVCERVHGPAPPMMPHAAHSCGNGHMGCVSGAHLFWRSVSENHIEKQIHGTDNGGVKHPLHRLSEDAVRFIRSNRERFSRASLAEKFGVSRSTIRDVEIGKSYRSVV